MICKRCVMDTTDSGIQFDENGICDHCRDFEEIVNPKWVNGKDNGESLKRVLNEIRKHGKGKEYDSILGLSGGVDSSYLLHKAIVEWKLRPLVFHVDGGWNSELAVHNIERLVTSLNLDLYTEVINWKEMRRFQLALFKSGVPHLDLPQDHAFVATLYNFAKENGIKYILNGGNISTECVQYPMEWFYYGTDMRHIKDIRMKFGADDMPSYPWSSVLRHKFYLKYIKGIQVIKPLDLIEFNKSEAMELLKETYDWKPYPQKHFESRFTRFYEGFWLPERFGFDTRKVQLSSLILTGQITRNEALEILSKPALTKEEVSKDFNYVASKLDISIADLQELLKIPKKFYWDYRNSQYLFKLGAVILRLMGVEKVKKRKK